MPFRSSSRTVPMGQLPPQYRRKFRFHVVGPWMIPGIRRSIDCASRKSRHELPLRWGLQPFLTCNTLYLLRSTTCQARACVIAAIEPRTLDQITIFMGILRRHLCSRVLIQLLYMQAPRLAHEVQHISLRRRRAISTYWICCRGDHCGMPSSTGFQASIPEYTYIYHTAAPGPRPFREFYASHEVLLSAQCLVQLPT